MNISKSNCFHNIYNILAKILHCKEGINYLTETIINYQTKSGSFFGHFFIIWVNTF